MHTFDDAGRCRTPGGSLVPIRLLQVHALDAQLAFETAPIRGMFTMTAAHAAVRHRAGLVMVHEAQIIPLVDYRSAVARGGGMAGAQVVVAAVQHRSFALMVDRVEGPLRVDHAEIRIPDTALTGRCPYLAGCLWRDGGEVYLVDLERLLGPAIRTYLHGRS